MHPNHAFDSTDRKAMLRFVAARAFAHIFCSGPQGLAVVHAPLLITPEGRIQFHISRRNRAAGQIAGNRLLVSVAGIDGYQSANWYASADQVPTWHYETVEIEGSARQLSNNELVNLLDGLSDRFEQLHSPDRPWTRGKMSPGKFDTMTKAIIGFEIDADAVRGTYKFNQHKGADDLAATLAGQRSAGRDDLAQAIVRARDPRE